MDGERRAMAILDNPGMSNAELSSVLKNFPGVVALHIFRQIVPSGFVHLSFAVIEFTTSKYAEEFVRSDPKLPEMTAMKLDRFYLSPVLALVTGLKRTEMVESYVKTFLAEGADSVRFFDTTNATAPLCCVLSFEDEARLTEFRNNIEGLVISGRPIGIVRLRFQSSALCVIGTNSKNKNEVRKVLGLQNTWDFTIYHYESEYKCWSGAAFALSSVMKKKILENHENFFQAPNILGPFQLIADYLHGETVEIKGDTAPFLLTMGKELGMNSLVKAVKRFLENATDPFTLVSLIAAYNEIGKIPESLINTAASIFEVIKDMKIFNCLPVSALVEILSSPAFLPDDEDSVFQWVMDFLEFSEGKFIVLIKNVNVAKLSKKCLIEFLDLPPSLIDLNEFRLSLSVIGMRSEYEEVSLLEPLNLGFQIDSSAFHSIFLPTKCLYDKKDLFKGIFFFYRTHFEKEKYSQKVEITASSRTNWKPDDLINYYQEKDYVFESLNISMSWIRTKLISDKASITGYSIKSHNDQGNGHMISWRLSGSNDGKDWQVIDSVSNCLTLQLENEAYFPLKNPSKNFSMFELRQLKSSSSGFYYLRLSRFELFGVISSNVNE